MAEREPHRLGWCQEQHRTWWWCAAHKQIMCNETRAVFSVCVCCLCRPRRSKWSPQSCTCGRYVGKRAHRLNTMRKLRPD